MDSNPFESSYVAVPAASVQDEDVYPLNNSGNEDGDGNDDDANDDANETNDNNDDTINNNDTNSKDCEDDEEDHTTTNGADVFSVRYNSTATQLQKWITIIIWSRRMVCACVCVTHLDH